MSKKSYFELNLRPSGSKKTLKNLSKINKNQKIDFKTDFDSKMLPFWHLFSIKFRSKNEQKKEAKKEAKKERKWTPMYP